MSTILIAEDDPLTGRIYAAALTRAGFNVQLATNGFAFMALFPECRPDALVVDMIMPDLSGVEIIKLVRTACPEKFLPIVAVTNAYIPAIITELEKAGANVVLNNSDLTTMKLGAYLKSMLNGHSILQTPGESPVLTQA